MSDPAVAERKHEVTEGPLPNGLNKDGTQLAHGQKNSPMFCCSAVVLHIPMEFGKLDWSNASFRSELG
jgi:hypothetical protein